MSDYDDNGWWMGDVAPLAVDAAYAMLAPELTSMLAAERLRHQAQRFFRIDLDLLTKKRYPGGGFPRVDRACFSITHDGDTREVEVITMPKERAPEIALAAVEAADAVRAGFEALVARTQRVWQVPAANADDPYPLALTLVLASVFLAPVMPPGGGTVFGVKTARLRLEAHGWRT